MITVICDDGHDPYDERDEFHFFVKGKVQKNVSFAFTHTYTPVKTNIFPFFPKRTWKILKNVQKRATLAHWEGGGGANSPL